MLKTITLSSNKKRIIFVALAVLILATALTTRQRKTELTVIEPSQKQGDAPNFSDMTDVNQKKQAFFDFLEPSVQLENQRVVKERAKLLEIQVAFHAGSLSSSDKKEATKLGTAYKLKVPSAGVTQNWISGMLAKVNVLPKALVLTQAANESAWGTSRFATEANNLFGQWCYQVGCGLVPLQRKEGATHEVAKFDNASESVHAYFMNVNRNPAYAELRKIRTNLSVQKNDLTSADTASLLTNGLFSYSERGQDYVNDLQSMIRINSKYWTAK